MATYNGSQIQEVGLNSQDSATGEITTSKIVDDSEITHGLGEGDTDPDDADYWTSSFLEGTLIFEDYDFLFTNTMNSGNTPETAMTNQTKLWLRIKLEGGELKDSGGNNRFEVRPRVSWDGDVGTDDQNVKPTFSFRHVDHSGVQKI